MWRKASLPERHIPHSISSPKFHLTSILPSGYTQAPFTNRSQISSVISPTSRKDLATSARSRASPSASLSILSASPASEISCSSLPISASYPFFLSKNTARSISLSASFSNNFCFAFFAASSAFLRLSTLLPAASTSARFSSLSSSSSRTRRSFLFNSPSTIASASGSFITTCRHSQSLTIYPRLQ